ncbi:MAG: hypothetical protein QXI36_02920 [Candidatus Bathyarchaeia archaeon]
MKNKITEEVERALGNPVKLRILRALAMSSSQALTKYELERKTYAKPTSLRRNLNELIALGWVEELPYTPRRYRLNLNNDTLRSLLKFFKDVHYI